MRNGLQCNWSAFSVTLYHCNLTTDSVVLEYVSIHRYIHVLFTRHIRHVMYTILTPTTVQIRKTPMSYVRGLPDISDISRTGRSGCVLAISCGAAGYQFCSP